MQKFMRKYEMDVEQAKTDGTYLGCMDRVQAGTMKQVGANFVGWVEVPEPDGAVEKPEGRSPKFEGITREAALEWAAAVIDQVGASKFCHDSEGGLYLKLAGADKPKKPSERGVKQAAAKAVLDARMARFVAEAMTQPALLAEYGAALAGGTAEAWLADRYK